MTRTILCAALALCLTQTSIAQGPVRRAIRGTAEATGDVARGAAEVTGDVARGAANLTANAAQATANGVRALTPNVPIEARAGGPIDRNARWRTQNYNGEYWYYTPENTWMVHRNNQWQPYSNDSQASTQQYASDQGAGSQQTVFIDSGGRAVMCQNGQIVFVDGTTLQSVARNQVNAQGYLIQPQSIQGQPQGVVQASANQPAQRSVVAAAGQAPASANGQVNGATPQAQQQSNQTGQQPSAGVSASTPSATNSASATIGTQPQGGAAGSDTQSNN